jgi:hypothetical protein
MSYLTIQQGDTGDAVRRWQAIIGVAQDGDFGPTTDAATRTWQKAHGIDPDGVVGPLTWQAAEKQEAPTKRTLLGVSGARKLSPDDLRAFMAAADWIGINPDWLATIIQFESGFDPAKPNAKGSGAIGLIQFMPPTARNLGTTTAALKGMTFKQQLEYVKKYFAGWRGRLHSLEDAYLAVFYPKAIGMQASDVVATEPSDTFTQNDGFYSGGTDSDGNRVIRKSDITRAILGVYNGAQSNPRIDIPVKAAIAVGTTIVLASLGYEIYKLWQISRGA